jgi:putative MATE family efflux protein
MFEGPLLPVLVRLALPTIAVMLMVTLLGVAETYFVSVVGTDAIAAAAMVLPVALLMTMISNGGIGGGVSTAIARARGAGRHEEVESLAWHALVMGVGFGAAFTLGLWLSGPTLYRFLGGTGASLDQAILYSNILFGGATAFWALMLLQAALRGVGNVKVPALIVAVSVTLGLIMSPMLISGWFGLPRLGVAGAGWSQVITNLIGLANVVTYMRSRRSTLALRRHPLKVAHFRAILSVGLPASLGATMTNLALTAVTAALGHFGVAALAGAGIAVRFDSLLVPLMFGFGTSVLTVVGTNLGAGNIARARRAALMNAIFVAACMEALGLVMASRPELWLNHFSQNPEVIAAGRRYLQMIGPTYGLTAISLELYFAGQGARRIGWPLAAAAARLACALAAAIWASTGAVELGPVLALIAAGIAGSAIISMGGFLRVRWSGKQ